jgi:hypothetical protein
MARMSAVVSVMITSITMNMEMIAPTKSPSREKSVAPKGMATRVPSTSPSRIATLLKNPGRNR